MRVAGRDSVAREGVLHVDPTSVVAQEQFKTMSVGGVEPQTRRRAGVRKRVRLETSTCNQSSKV